MVLGILILIEAIFIAESFTSLMRIVAENGGSVWQLALVLLLKSPEIFDFALPLALMLGVYFAVTGARDDRELVVCAAAGVPGARVSLFAFAAGMVGFAVSILFAGFVTPASQYALRLSSHQLEANRIRQHLVDPGQRRLIHSVDSQTVLAVPSADPESRRGNLFFFDEMDDGSWRFSQSDDWSAEGPMEDGRFEVHLKSYREVFGGAPAPAEAEAGAARLRDQLRVTARTVAVDVNVDGLIPLFDQVPRHHELLMHKHVSFPEEGGLLPTPNPRFAEILVRALLCPIAAVLAAAAATWSGGRVGRYLALPALTVGVLACDVSARAILVDAARQGAEVFWSSTALLMTAVLGGPSAYLAWMREAVVRPSRRA